MEEKRNGAGRTISDKQLAAIEGDYRSGHFSLRQVGARNRVSEGTVRRLAKEHGWKQDLHQQINERTAQIINGQVNVATLMDEDEALVEQAAQRAATVLTRIRNGADQMILIGEKLREDLLKAIEQRPELEAAVLAETEHEQEDGTRRVDGVMRARLMHLISVPAHIDALKNLAMATEKIHSEAFRAYSIVVAPPKPPEQKPVSALVDDRLAELAKRIGGVYGLPSP